MRLGRRLAFAILTTATTLFSLAGACGFEVAGTPGDGPPDGRPEASLPPQGDDANFTDTTQQQPDGNPPPTDSGADAGSSRCDAAGLRGPAMVASPTGDFCIDTTEVTSAQYAQFLASVGGDAGFVDASTLDGGFNACTPFDGFQPSPAYTAGSPTEPVHNISYCDALAYCQWAGKRLCRGGLQGDAGTGNEWFRACTNNGARPVPYGPTPDLTSCTVNGGPTPVGSKATCVGGYAGLFDMVGNVAEFVDDCTNAGCALSGGYWFSTTNAVCTFANRIRPNDPNLGGGIRCCR